MRSVGTKLDICHVVVHISQIEDYNFMSLMLKVRKRNIYIAKNCFLRISYAMRIQINWSSISTSNTGLKKRKGVNCFDVSRRI